VCVALNALRQKLVDFQISTSLVDFVPLFIPLFLIQIDFKLRSSVVIIVAFFSLRFSSLECSDPF